MKNMYEAINKEKFMNTVKNKTRYRWLFDKSFKYENKFSKDLFNFNKGELLEFLASRKMSFESLKVNLSNIKSYINWAYEDEGIKLSSRNAADEITDADLREISQKKRSLLHVDEVYDIIGRSPNPVLPELKNMQDKLLIQLLFIGVRGERASELINLRFKHIDFENRLIKLSELDPYREDIRIDDFCLNLIKATKNEQDYVRYMDEENFETTNIKEDYELAESDFVFRRSKVGKKTEELNMSYSGIVRRLQTLSKYTGLRLNMNIIESSGMTYVAKKAIDAGYELKINNPVIIKSIFDKYNINNTGNSRHALLTKIRKDLKEVYPDDEQS